MKMVAVAFVLAVALVGVVAPVASAEPNTIPMRCWIEEEQPYRVPTPVGSATIYAPGWECVY